MPVFSQVTLNGAGTAAATATSWIPLNQFETPFNVGFGVVIGTGASGKYTVQHTFDDVFNPSVTPTAFDHSTVSGKSANIDGNYAFPVAAVRLRIASASGNDSFTLSVRQVGL